MKIFKLRIIESLYFRRIYLTFLAFFLITGCLLVVTLNHNLRSSIKNRELASIQEKLVLLSPQASEIFNTLNFAKAQAIFPHRSLLTNTRYTMIARRGEIIADSHFTPETIVGGWSFPEVIKDLLSKNWAKRMEGDVEKLNKTSLLANY